MTELQAIRERRKLTAAQVAVKAEISERQLLNLEHPDYAGCARMNTRLAVAAALGVRWTTIFDYYGRPKPARVRAR